MTTLEQHLILGEPQVSGPLAVFPVLGPDSQFAYRTFAEAVGLGAVVKELDSGASVNDLLLSNTTDQPLLVYEGEEVLGAQQNRTFDVSALIAAGTRVTLPVSCVEAGRWDGGRVDEPMSPSPQAADPSLRRVKRAAANRVASAGAVARADQGEVWREVDERLALHCVDSESAALSDLYDDRRRDLDELLRAVRPVEDQVGAVACVGGTPVALDLVSRRDVFAALLPRLAQGYALDALGSAERGPDQERAEDFLHGALEAPRIQVATPGAGRGLAIAAQRIVGSGLEHEGELVQLCAFPADADSRSNRPIAGPSVRSRRTR